MNIVDLKENDVIKDPMRGVVLDLFQGMTKQNSPFVSLKISDKTGSLDMVIWSTTKEEFPFRDGDIIEFTGSVSKYQNRLQLKTDMFEKTEGNPLDYLIGITDERREVLITRFAQLVDMAVSPYNELLQLIMADASLWDKFIYCPAAVFHHGNHIGGLLEHTINVTNYALLLSDDVNKPLLITAALLHDFGKIFTYDYNPVIKVTPMGALLDHIVLGVQFIPKVINKLRKEHSVEFSKEDELLLLHCIVAHQGKKEWGSPVEPRIKEAMMLFIADKASYDVEVYNKEIQNVSPGESTYSQVLKGFLYNPASQEF